MKKAICKRWWFIVLAVLAVITAAAAVVWSSTTVLQKTFIRLLCAGNAGVQSPDYDAVLERVETRAENESYSSRFDNGCLDVFAPRGGEPLPLVIYAHGGYYVGDDKGDFTYYCQKLASYGYVVANINYQLAPEGRYPTQILQVNEAAAYLLANAEKFGIDPNSVFIAGDSAGAHLASQMGLYYTNPAFQGEIGNTPALVKEQLRGVILHCGYYNIDTLRATGFPMIADSVWMMTGVKHYEGTEDANLMNTVAQVTPDYPAVFIDCGDKDPFLSQANEMIAALEQNGVAVTSYLPVTEKFPLMHEFQVRINMAEGLEAMERLAGFLGEKN